jgi:hypothetical protein
VPGQVEVLTLSFAEMLQSKIRQDAIQDHAVQIINACPPQLARANALHGGLIARTPREGESIGVYIGRQRLNLSLNAAMPVHHGTKDIECEYLDLRAEWVDGRHKIYLIRVQQPFALLQKTLFRWTIATTILL